MEAEAAGFEDFDLLVLIDFFDGVGIERLEPFHVAIRLGGDEREVFIIEAKRTRRALF